MIDEKELKVRIRDREHGKIVESPNTAALLDQALDLKSFTQMVLQEETKDIQEKEEIFLGEKRKKYGIVGVVS